MKGTVKFCILIALAVLLVISPVTAITNGVSDGNNHPYGCIIVFYDNNDTPLWRTSGALIAPAVVLTAGHGTYGTDHAKVWFETDIRPTDYPYGNNSGTTSINGSVYTHPDYLATVTSNGLPGFDYHDVGIVVLENEPTGIVPADLPGANQADTLSSMTPVDLVGYGMQWQQHGKGVTPYNAWEWSGLRFYAPAQYVASNDRLSAEFLKMTANPGKGKGGIAYGDSGGPILLGGTDTILGINTFVTNPNCAGVTYAQRIDIPDILAWIEDFTDS